MFFEFLLRRLLPRRDVIRPGGSAVGSRGEDVAADYLRKLGYTIDAINWRGGGGGGGGEIDLVARHGRTRVFVEVKTRTGGYLPPEAQVNKAKRLRIVRTARRYLLETRGRGSVRFDVVAVVVGGAGRPEIRHYPDAFDWKGRVRAGCNFRVS